MASTPKRLKPLNALVGDGQDRLYQKLARKLFGDLASGRYAVGDRLPAERDLAVEHNVSRATAREAMIALEVRGVVEVRVGSGAYVRKIPGTSDTPGFHVTGFELIEARIAIEGEAAALAAAQITDAELDRVDTLVDEIAIDNLRGRHDTDGYDQADREFHYLIARATRNAAIVNTVEQLWSLRDSSPDVALLLAKARAAEVKPIVEEHRAIAQALRSRDPEKARAAMRAHLSAVLGHLLFATEEAAVEQARSAAQATRERFAIAQKR